VDQVLSFYERTLAEEGLLPVSYQYSPNAGYVGYLELSTQRMHVVAVIRQRDETLVFPSSSDPEAMLNAAAEPPPVGAFTGAEGSVAMDVGGQKMWVASFPNRTLEDVSREWREGLVGRGWKLSDAVPGAAGEVRFDAVREGAAPVQVAVQAKGSQVAVYVSMRSP
jgi:hypothetical protein